MTFSRVRKTAKWILLAATLFFGIREALLWNLVLDQASKAREFAAEGERWNQLSPLEQDALVQNIQCVWILAGVNHWPEIPAHWMLFDVWECDPALIWRMNLKFQQPLKDKSS